jgi:hypothetical protein
VFAAGLVSRTVLWLQAAGELGLVFLVTVAWLFLRAPRSARG